MKKIISLILILLFFGINLENSFSDLESKKFKSVYSSSSGKNIGFRNTGNFFLEGDLYKYYYGININSYYIKYSQNFRMFLPNFVTEYEFTFNRYASIGFIDGYLSMGKLPSVTFETSSNLPIPNYGSNEYGSRDILFARTSYDPIYITDYSKSKKHSWIIGIEAIQWGTMVGLPCL